LKMADAQVRQFNTFRILIHQNKIMLLSIRDDFTAI
jgi:hypothetical protein